MSIFEDKKQEIINARAASARKTFNAEQFDELGTALLNEHDYVANVAKQTKDGFQEQETTPVKDFRKSVIGGIMKAAGHDADETKKYVEEYKFSTIPLYPVVSEMVEQYMRCGKAFVFKPKSDMRASITMDEKPEEVKEVKVPSTGEVIKTKMGAYKKVKVKSTCPANLRNKV